MATIKTELFENDGKTYEIRVEGSGWDYTVRAFLNGKPANGYRYSVSLPTAFDLRTVAELDAIKVLADSAKRDIKDKIWEQYVDAYIKTLSNTEDQTVGCRNCAHERSQSRQSMSGRCSSARTAAESGMSNV